MEVMNAPKWRYLFEVVINIIAFAVVLTFQAERERDAQTKDCMNIFIVNYFELLWVAINRVFITHMILGAV